MARTVQINLNNFLLRAILLAALFTSPLGTDANAGTNTSCKAAISASAKQHRIPIRILTAIALVESGYTMTGEFAPWPWTINLKGKGFRFASKASATEFITRQFITGVRNFDIGCFQINFRWHGASFNHPTDLLDPLKNADYAGHFLRSLFKEFGTWDAAIAAFHSRNTTVSGPYLERVKQMSAQLQSMPTPPSQPDKTLSRLPHSRNEPRRTAGLGSLFHANDKDQ